MRKVCLTYGGSNPFDGATTTEIIELHQTHFDEFSVTYGLQVRKNLSYAQAAKELGECILHHLACEGGLDNRTRSEAREDGDKAPRYDS